MTKVKDFTITLGPLGPTEDKEKLEAAATRSGKSIEDLWIEVGHQLLRRATERESPEAESLLDACLSTLLGTPARVNEPFLTYTYTQDARWPTVILDPNKIVGLTGSPLEIDWAATDVCRELAAYLREFFKTEWATSFVAYEPEDDDRNDDDGGVTNLLAALAEYGQLNDVRMVSDLLEQYRKYMTEASAEERFELMQAVTSLVTDGTTSINALNPFVSVEVDFSVASTAALNYAVLMPLDQGDPMTGPKYILGLARSHPDQDMRTALLAGLISLGDQRVTELLIGQWSLLDVPHQVQLTRVWNENPWAGTVEFYIRWLESLVDDGQPFGAIAGLLARMPADSKYTTVHDCERPFPINSPEAQAAKDEASAKGQPFGYRILGDWTFAEYGELIGRRLAAIERREPPPKVMTAVLQAWGITPPPSHDLSVYADLARVTLDPETRLCSPIKNCHSLEEAQVVQELLSWVYFNPLAPTHVTLALFRVQQEALWLLGVIGDHPFLPFQTVYGLLSPVEIRDGDILALAAASLFYSHGSEHGDLLRNMPTHVYIPDGSPWSMNAAMELFWLAAQLAETDFETSIDKLRKYWLDPWGRTQEEFQESLQRYAGPWKAIGQGRSEDAARAVRAIVEDFYTGDPPGRDLFNDWWGLITHPAHVRAEQRELIEAWEGAIQFQKGQLDSYEAPERIRNLSRAAL